MKFLSRFFRRNNGSILWRNVADCARRDHERRLDNLERVTRDRIGRLEAFRNLWEHIDNPYHYARGAYKRIAALERGTHWHRGHDCRRSLETAHRQMTVLRSRIKKLERESGCPEPALVEDAVKRYLRERAERRREAWIWAFVFSAMAAVIGFAIYGVVVTYTGCSPLA